MILDKAKMAHDWVMKYGKVDSNYNRENTVQLAWQYADAMQAEADKREKEEAAQKRKEIREMLNAPNTFVEREGQHFDDVEWQPDWNQAPAWANWWAMDGFSKKANWYTDKPYLDDDSEVESEWNTDLKTNTETYMHAPSFEYQGNWKDSLRKRPFKKEPIIDWSNVPKDAIAYKIVDGIVQYLHGTRSSDGTLCGGYLANDGWIKLENQP